MTAVLKLVQAEQFRDEIRIPDEGAVAGRDSHALQGALQYASPWSPFLARYVIDRFSNPGDRVLDPMCGVGTVGLEALLLGRHFVGCAQDHTLVSLSLGRINPADIAEVALRLQFVPFKRPVNIASFVEPFTHFFHVSTFRELINAKVSLRQSSDRVSDFIKFIVASIVHGHTSGHLSVYTSPSEGLNSEAQVRLNSKRGETPSYRAVSPRVLRKAAFLLRDGVCSSLSEASSLSRSVFYSSPNSLDGVQGESIDLAVIGFNQPGFFEHGIQSWLRSWWIGVDDRERATRLSNLESWNGYANETLVEMARVVKRGGRLVLRVGHGRIGSTRVNYGAEIIKLVKDCLGSFWRIEGSLEERHVRPKKPIYSDVAHSTELLVLRRC